MAKTQLSINALFETLRSNPDLPVTFSQNEHAISPGYHVTEVKTSLVHSLDCGHGTDQWHELVIQLLDGNAESSQPYMHSTKLAGILDKALGSKHTDDDTKLYFEFAPGNKALHKSSISAIEIANNAIVISLNATTAQCKPYQRALASGMVSAGKNGCCGDSAPMPSRGCCDSGSPSTTTSCCN